MGNESVEEMLNQKLEEKAKIKEELDKVNDEYDTLMKQEEALETKERILNKEIEQLRKANFNEGFEQWKANMGDSIERIKPITWEFTKEQTLKAKYIEDVYGTPSGAAGGGTVYEIIPTGVGTAITLKVSGKEFDLTEEADF